METIYKIVNFVIIFMEIIKHITTLEHILIISSYL